MKILGHGIDMVSIERFQEVMARQGDAFVKRAFTDEEFAYCSKHKAPAQHFAARFAAKEAFGKAVGLGIGASGDLREVGVVRTAAGMPRLELTGRAAQEFQKFGGKEIHLSLSHDGGFALASVIVTG